MKSILWIATLLLFVTSCGEYREEWDYDLYSVAKKSIIAEYSETTLNWDLESETENWSEEASEVYFTTTKNDTVTEYNFNKDLIFKVDNIHIPGMYPPVERDFSKDKHFSKYSKLKSVDLRITIFDKDLKLTSDKYRAVLKRKLAEKPIYIHSVFNWIKTEKSN